jgi:hypothetical protein
MRMTTSSAKLSQSSMLRRNERKCVCIGRGREHCENMLRAATPPSVRLLKKRFKLCAGRAPLR